MVRFDGVDDVGGFLILFRQFDADSDMRTLDLVGHRLADVMQQAGPAGKGGVGADLGSDHPRNISDLGRMNQDILPVAGAVAHPAEQADQLGMDRADRSFQHDPLAVLLDLGVNLALGLVNHLLDAGGMDAAVVDQPLERDAGHLAADRVVARKGNRLGGVIDDEIDSGERLKCADIAALAADNTPLHLIAGQRHDRDGRFRDLVGGAPLDRQRDDIAGLEVGLFLQAALHLGNPQGLLVGQLLLEVFEQIFLRLLSGKARNLLEQVELALFDRLGFLELGFGVLQLLLERLFLLIEVVDLLIHRLFLVLNPALETGDFVAPFLHFAFGFALETEDFILCFDEGFLLLDFSRLDRFTYDSFCLGFGCSKFLLCNLLSILNAQGKGNYNTDY